MPKTMIEPEGMPPGSGPWWRAVNSTLNGIARTLGRMHTDFSAATRGLAATVGSLSETVALVQGQVSLLLEMAAVQQAGWSAGASGFTGFYSGARPTISIKSSTGRIEVGFGGALNGGDGYFVYSIAGLVSGSIVNRAVVQDDPARRVAISGGASFAPSGWKTETVAVPKDEGLVVTLEMYANDNYTYFFGGSLMARVSP